MSKAIFGQIAASKASAGGNYIKPGKYLFEVQKILAEKKFKGDMFIAEMKVLEAVQTGVDKDGKPVIPNAVGTSCSFVVNLGLQSGPGNAKSFCMALFNEPEEAITVEALEEVCGPTQPGRFLRIRTEAYDKPIKSKPGQFFTAQKWEYVELDTAALQAIQDRRKIEG